jgi:hypothetical protein
MTFYRKEKKSYTWLYLIILIAIVYCYNRFTRPELYDSANDFQYEHVTNGTVKAQLIDFEWYTGDDISDNYYVFTNIGKLYINHSDFFHRNESFSDELEEYLYMECTLFVEDTFLRGWSVTGFTNCVELNIPTPTINEIINNDVPESTPFESDVPPSSDVYSDIPD